VSPIYVRPAREQSEHDRLIRHLQTKYAKKFDVAVNIDGVEPITFVKIGPATLAPDLVLTEGKKLAGLVEIETGESVNNLEAMAQWVHFSKARVAFHLYVPVDGYEPARRLCDSYQARVGEIWTYRPTHDGFDLVRMHSEPAAASGVRGTKALPVSIFVPPPPKPVVPEVIEPPRPVTPPKPAAPAKATTPGKPAAKAPTKPDTKAPTKPDTKAPTKPVTVATKPVAAAAKPVAAATKVAVATKPASDVKAKAAGKSANPPKAAKAGKPAKGGKASNPAKAKAASKPAPKARKPVPARGKKPVARKRR
jgi:hypothetical protein